MDTEKREYREYCDNCRMDGIEPPSFMDWLNGDYEYDHAEIENTFPDDLYA